LSYAIQTAIGNQLEMSDSEKKTTSIFNKYRQAIRRGNQKLNIKIMKFKKIIYTYVLRAKKLAFN
jgi:hypothetical protein